MNKQTSKAFGKEIYLLGADSDGVKHWLEAPKWDCGWYWGFGYVETYTNNNDPSKARDIESHQHADGEYIAPNSAGTGKVYNSDTNLFTGDFLQEKTFTEAEGWTLRELFATFYQLRKEAELYGRGGMHQSTNPLADKLKDEARAKEINEKTIPMVTAKIVKILS